MRRVLPVLLTAALLCALCACGGRTRTAPEAPAEEPAVPAAPAPQPVAPAPAEEPAPAPAEEPEEPAPQEEPASADEPAETVPEPKSGETSAPADLPAPEPADPEPEKPAEQPVEAPPAKPAGDSKTIAQGLVGRPVNELYAAIGKPLSADYAPSCLIDGDDGELTYDGFVVYTERGADYETVYAVM